ncbi:MAG TPA: DUF881 domain-containing protein [Intrasporangiaceae bacterium]|nr:DUF881 domain-containing protein [Intrasporangiaceae bacterium]
MPENPERAAAQTPEPTEPTGSAVSATPERGGQRAPDPVTGKAAWRRLLRMGSPRATRANVIVTALALTLGFAIAAQVRQTDLEGLSNLREDELVRILDNITQENSRLGGEIRELERTRGQLAAGATSEEARAAAQARLDAIQILSGTVPASGPGIVLTITDPEQRITGMHLLDAVQELRDAGSEVIEINGVRVVASTYFTDVDGDITVSGQRIARPYVVRAIGDPPTMAAAMDIPGGVRESVRQQNAEATVDQRDTLDITSLHTPVAPEYAQPIPTPTS